MTSPVPEPGACAVACEVKGPIATVRLERPDKANALDESGWHALRAAFEAVDATPGVRAVVLHGNGTHFCAGIDLEVLAGLRMRFEREAGCAGRSREALERWIGELQDCVTAIERCRCPVIAALHGACIGGGMDIACAADIRIASADLRACVKEVDMAVTADLGVLQRLPDIVGGGIARELALTAREFGASYSERIGFVTRIFASRSELLEGAYVMAEALSRKSPLALRGTKRVLTNARLGMRESLREVATLNAATLFSADLEEAISSVRQRRAARFQD